MKRESSSPVSRHDLLRMIGVTAGSSALYQAMDSLGLAAESPYRGPGRNGMPPFGLPADQVSETRTAHLSDMQIADVVNHVRSSFGNHYKDKITAKQVAGLPHPGRISTP